MHPLPKGILFDLDDTIISSGDRHQLVLDIAIEFKDQLGSLEPTELANEVESAFIKFWADEHLHKIWRFRLLDARVLIISDVFENLRDRSPELTPEFAREFAEQFHNTREGAHSRLIPGALETLDELKKRGVRLALITNGPASTQRAKVVRFDLEHRFEHIQIEGEVGFGKPEEQAYTHALNALGLEAEDTWMVGDNFEWEVVAPKRLGIRTIWNDLYKKGLPANPKVIPDRIVHSISEILRPVFDDTAGVIGILEGQITVPEDFNKPLSEDLLDLFEGKGSDL